MGEESEPDSLRRRASCGRLRVVRALAGVLVVRSPLLADLHRVAAFSLSPLSKKELLRVSRSQLTSLVAVPAARWPHLAGRGRDRPPFGRAPVVRPAAERPTG